MNHLKTGSIDRFPALRSLKLGDKFIKHAGLWTTTEQPDLFKHYATSIRSVQSGNVVM